MTRTYRGVATVFVTPVLAIMAALLLSACDPMQAGSAALVGDVRITETQVNEAAAAAAAAAATIPPGQSQGIDPTTLLRQNLNRLISAELLARVAIEEGITVTPAEVDALLVQAAAGATRADFEAQIASQTGVPPTDLESFARDFLVQQKLGQKLAPGADQAAQAAAVQARLAQEAAEVGVTVSPRYGAWDATNGGINADLNDLSVPATPAASPEVQ